ncbi:MAG: hypothetical protein JW818_08805 [Pirellulales bacterium]|nr:hypothetical protein [Pirellulales bacterium]
MIEIFFRTLKSGCRVEERHFEYLDRLLPCVGIYLGWENQKTFGLESNIHSHYSRKNSPLLSPYWRAEGPSGRVKEEPTTSLQ